MKKFSILERVSNHLIINAPFFKSAGLDGKAGSAFFFYKMYRKTNNKVFENIAEDLLDMIFEEINLSTSCGYSSGLAGIGCVVDYLIDEKYVEADKDEVLEDIDEAVFKLDRKRFKHDHDYNDFYGVGLYFLVRNRNGYKQWSNDALRYIISDFEFMAKDITENKKQISNDFAFSLILFLFKTGNLFEDSILDSIYAICDSEKNDFANFENALLNQITGGATNYEPDQSHTLDFADNMYKLSPIFSVGDDLRNILKSQVNEFFKDMLDLKSLETLNLMSIGSILI